jgi:hypothetical protein
VNASAPKPYVGTLARPGTIGVEFQHCDPGVRRSARFFTKISSLAEFRAKTNDELVLASRCGLALVAKGWLSCGFFDHASIILTQCGAIDLVTSCSPVRMPSKGMALVMALSPAHEDLMKLKIQAKAAVLFAAIALVAVGFDAGAQTPPNSQIKQAKRQIDDRGRPVYGANGPNVVYQQGPNTRVYITRRSWLDAGTEVLPGDRKFQDYAFPPAIGYPTFARENNNRPIDRQPLNPPSDVPPGPTRFPLY